MIVQRFWEWSQTASATQRADGVSALARAYLYSDMSEDERAAAEMALTAQLDDASPLVRKALAESFARAEEAPRHIIVALANDQSDISTLVLGRSPILTDNDLVDCAAIGDAFAQSAIALRPNLSLAVAAAIAEVGAREAAISLLVNDTAYLSEAVLYRIAKRFGDDGEVREAMLLRPHLPQSLRGELVLATARALGDFVTRCEWLSTVRAERITRDAREKAQLIIAAEDCGDGSLSFARYLRTSGQLTAGLVLRALLSGNHQLFEATLSELSGQPLARVAGLCRDWRGTGFAALYNKAQLPQSLFTAFKAALEARAEIGAMHNGSARLSRKMIERVLTACDSLPAQQTNGVEIGKVIALLRRFELEAVKEEAQERKSQALAASLETGRDEGYGLVINMAELEAELLVAA